MAERGMYHHCKQYHGVTSVSDGQAKITAEDAQDPADYYTVDDHEHNGACCDGSGKAPESLAEEDGPDDWPSIPGEFEEVDDPAADAYEEHLWANQVLGREHK